MKRNEIYSNICTNHFLLAIPLFGNAKTTCLDKVAVLELKRDHAISSSGVWAYFDAVSEILENDFWKTGAGAFLLAILIHGKLKLGAVVANY